MTRKEIASRICLVAAFTFSIAGPLTRPVLAESLVESAFVEETTFTAVAGDSGSFAVRDAAVAATSSTPEAIVTAGSGRVRTPWEVQVSRYYRWRYRFYNAIHMYPRPWFDPMWMLELGLVVGVYFTARLLGLLDETEEDDEQTASMTPMA